MRILDLDLDFFLDNISYFRADDYNRLSSKDYKPWLVISVRRFLERRCGLSVTAPLEGRIVDHHDEAFDFWRQLVESDELTAPFDVTHVDAHSDLGLGDIGYRYLMTELLQYEPELRLQRLERTHVEFGNYLAFAIACRWVNSVQWIRHPGPARDLPRLYFNHMTRRSGVIQLRRVDRKALDAALLLTFDDPPGLAFEPHVVFQTRVWKSFKDTGLFDYIVLSKSPGFTPIESDELVPIIAEYIKKT